VQQSCLGHCQFSIGKQLPKNVASTSSDRDDDVRKRKSKFMCTRMDHSSATEREIDEE